MPLSDEILLRPQLAAEIRLLLQSLVAEIGARSAFLVDACGTPFAARGNVEFKMPHPLAALDGGARLLEALLGKRPAPSSSDLVVEPVGNLALLAVIPGNSLSGRQAAQAAQETVARLLALLAERPAKQ